MLNWCQQLFFLQQSVSVDWGAQVRIKPQRIIARGFITKVVRKYKETLRVVLQTTKAGIWG